MTTKTLWVMAHWEDRPPYKAKFETFATREAAERSLYQWLLDFNHVDDSVSQGEALDWYFSDGQDGDWDFGCMIAECEVPQDMEAQA